MSSVDETGIKQGRPGHRLVMRSNQGYYTRSHQNSEVKRLWAGIVLGWVTSREVPVLHPLFGPAWRPPGRGNLSEPLFFSPFFFSHDSSSRTQNQTLDSRHSPLATPGSCGPSTPAPALPRAVPTRAGRCAPARRTRPSTPAPPASFFFLSRFLIPHAEPDPRLPARDSPDSPPLPRAGWKNRATQHNTKRNKQTNKRTPSPPPKKKKSGTGRAGAAVGHGKTLYPSRDFKNKNK